MINTVKSKETDTGVEKGKQGEHSTSFDSWHPEMADEAVFAVLLLTCTGASNRICHFTCLSSDTSI